MIEDHHYSLRSKLRRTMRFGMTRMYFHNEQIRRECDKSYKFLYYASVNRVPSDT